ncbi:DNA repair protein SWI5 homolog [Haliotis rubra]|uniref:DNA repair protein SWI5 homolog n=1 Tax=Haliotis rubra TaxID=36100 RepID=UPI001EE634DB|nr:DNA repair protein SWI5 homolog [Haliotis rubra]
MASTPKQTNSKQSVQRRNSQGNFKSPLGQLFKSPLGSTRSLTPESEETLQADIVALHARLSEVETEIQQLVDEGYKQEELQTHIEKLHEYNEIKDTGQMILGRIATMEAVRTKDLYERYSLGLED